MAGQVFFEPTLVELRVIETAERRRQPAQRGDQRTLSCEDVGDNPEPRILGEFEAALGLALDAAELVARREQVCEHEVRTVAGIREIADLVRDLESARSQISTLSDRKSTRMNS